MDVMKRLIDCAPVSAGTVMKTPSGRGEFRIKQIGREGIEVEVGKGGYPIHIPRECWNGLPEFLENKGWVRIGATHSITRDFTLDSYLKRFTSGTSAASYVATILEKAGLVKIDRSRPNKILFIKQI